MCLNKRGASTVEWSFKRTTLKDGRNFLQKMVRESHSKAYMSIQISNVFDGLIEEVRAQWSGPSEGDKCKTEGRNIYKIW